MAKEPFLINPPKRAPKSKAKRHRILALSHKGGLFTSKEAKIVRKGIKLNPFHRFRKNPLGEELMFVGLNPFKKGGQKMAHRKRHKKRHYKKNPARRRYRRNPMSSTKALIPMVVAGGAGVLVGRVIPGMIPVLNKLGALGKLLSQVGLAIGGSMLLDKTIGSKFRGVEDGWMVGSLASAAADLSGAGIVRTMQGIGMITDETIAPYNGGGNGTVAMEGIVDDPYFSGASDPY